MQHLFLVAVSADNNCFSIHKRIEGGATFGFDKFIRFFVPFQYPQADRRGCNLDLRNVSGLQKMFQYPQADRRGCNHLAVRPPPLPPPVSVSTSGSKGVQRISLMAFILFFAVSVSTSGSKGVQPYRDCRKRRLVFYVSVSTSGSKGVQQGVFEMNMFRLMSFSIHKRIEGGATFFFRRRGIQLKVFQYPQADRRGCN